MVRGHIVQFVSDLSGSREVPGGALCVVLWRHHRLAEPKAKSVMSKVYAVPTASAGAESNSSAGMTKRRCSAFTSAE